METDLAVPRRLGVAVLAATFVPTFAFLALMAAVSVVGNVPPATFSRDPTATLGGNPLTGVQSHVGVLVWWTAAGICFFTAAVLRRGRGDAAWRGFLVWSGSITAVLTLDDLFQFHEDLAVRYLGVHDKLVVLTYGAAVAAYLVRFRREILRTEYPLLIAGLGLFAGSNVVDVILQDRWNSDWRIFVEDGFKLVGIASWSAYLVRTALHLAVSVLRPAEIPVPGRS